MKITNVTPNTQQNKAQVNFGACTRIFKLHDRKLPNIDEPGFQACLKSINFANTNDVLVKLGQISDMVKAGTLDNGPDAVEQTVLKADEEGAVLRDVILSIRNGLTFVAEAGKRIVFRVNGGSDYKPMSSLLVLDETDVQKPAVSFITRFESRNIRDKGLSGLESDALTFTRDEESGNARFFDYVLGQLRQFKDKLVPKKDVAPEAPKAPEAPAPAPKQPVGAPEEEAPPVALKPKKPEILRLRKFVNGEKTNSKDGLVPCIQKPGVNVYWFPEGSNKDASAHFVVEFVKKGSQGVPELSHFRMTPDPDKFPFMKPYIEWFGINPDDYRLITPTPAKA